MKAVVDTNVIAYYLLATPPFTAEVDAFWRSVDDPMAPALWEAELVNTLWMSARQGVTTAELAHRRLADVALLGIRSVPMASLVEAALAIALRANASGYDALFVELAVREKRPLATFDRRLLAAFPRVAARPAALLRKR